MIQTPRTTGEVVVPLAVTLSTLACVRKPPRTLSFGKETLRKAEPVTPGRPYNVARRSFTNTKSAATTWRAGRSPRRSSAKNARLSSTQDSARWSSR